MKCSLYLKIVRLHVALLIAVLLMADTSAQSIELGDKSVKLVPFYSFQANPTTESSATNMVQLPDGRFLVSTQGGTVRMIDQLGNHVSTLLSPQETGLTELDPIRYGMITLAVHPDFATPDTFGFGKLYLHVTEEPVQDTGVLADFTISGSTSSSPFVFQDAIKEFDVSTMLTQGVTSYVGQTVNSRDILRVDQPQSSHNVADMVFRDNGDLYISVGDAGFTELNSFSGLHNRRQAAQDLDQPYGKILRINPNPDAYASKGGNNNQYSVPDDNPFTTTPGAVPEIYANGVRSPFRLNLDPNDPTGETLWLGDVGEGAREEVSKITKGANLGWGRFEGTNTSNGSIVIDGNTPIDPEFQYTRSVRSLVFSNGDIVQYNATAGGRSISGGNVYAGSLLGPEFQGLYIGGELGHHAGTTNNLARLYYGDPDSESLTLSSFQYSDDSQLFDNDFISADKFVEGFDFEAAGLVPGKGNLPQLVLGVMEDNQGELYVLGADFNGLSTISRIVPADQPIGNVVGDYNLDDEVNAADYTVWRDSLGATGSQAADGNLDGSVDEKDFQVWQTQFGQKATSSLTLVVDPITGSGKIVNNRKAGYALDSYSISASQDSLNPNGWSSLADQGVDNSAWSESSATDGLLAESSSSDNVIIDGQGSLDLGKLFDTSGVANLTASYSVAEENSQTTNLVVVYESDVVLMVDTGTGMVELFNGSTESFTIDGYAAFSESGSLDPDAWLSLDEQAIEGDTWEETNTSTAVVSELNPTAATTFLPGSTTSLGALFDTTGQTDLAFELALATRNDAIRINVLYDFPLGSLTVPEPGSLALLTLAGMVVCLSRGGRRGSP